MVNKSGSSHKGQKVKCYTIYFKLKVVEFAKQNNNNTLTATTFGVDRKKVIEWRKAEQELRKSENISTRMRLDGAGKKVKNVDIDQHFIRWLEDRRASGGRVTGILLKRQALTLHKTQYLLQKKYPCWPKDACRAGRKKRNFL
jgi:hypothetical protein